VAVAGTVAAVWAGAADSVPCPEPDPGPDPGPDPDGDGEAPVAEAEEDGDALSPGVGDALADAVPVGEDGEDGEDGEAVSAGEGGRPVCDGSSGMLSRTSSAAPSRAGDS
jgi:hypothetical protein